MQMKGAEALALRGVADVTGGNISLTLILGKQTIFAL